MFGEYLYQFYPLLIFYIRTTLVGTPWYKNRIYVLRCGYSLSENGIHICAGRIKYIALTYDGR
jgi:hypothetical protein